MNARSRRRRGVTLIEIIVALSLVSLTGTIATRLLWTTLHTGQEMQDIEANTRVTDRLATTLRRDVERAATVTSLPGGVTIGDVRWTLDGNTAVRQVGDAVERFVLPDTQPGREAKLWTEGKTVYLRVGADAYTTWALTPIIGRGDR